MYLLRLVLVIRWLQILNLDLIEGTIPQLLPKKSESDIFSTEEAIRVQKLPEKLSEEYPKWTITRFENYKSDPSGTLENIKSNDDLMMI